MGGWSLVPGSAGMASTGQTDGSFARPSCRSRGFGLSLTFLHDDTVPGLPQNSGDSSFTWALRKARSSCFGMLKSTPQVRIAVVCSEGLSFSFLFTEHVQTTPQPSLGILSNQRHVIFSSPQYSDRLWRLPSFLSNV